MKKKDALKNTVSLGFICAVVWCVLFDARFCVPYVHASGKSGSMHNTNRQHVKFRSRKSSSILHQKHTKDQIPQNDNAISVEKNTRGDNINAPFGNTLSLNAKYAILVDYNSGAVLYEKNADTLTVPSSMTKIMTTYIAFKKLQDGLINLHDKFVVSEKAWRTGGSKMFVPLGTSVQVSDLLRGIIVQSGNDACVVLAEGISGSEDEFVDEMNKQAEKLGMVNTKFFNSTGLPHEGHVSTVRDLAILGTALIHDFPQYYTMYSQPTFTFNNIKQANRNLLLGKYGVDGIKTGHTDDGGYGIVISAMMNGRRLVGVVNGLNGEKERIDNGTMLITYGFNKSKLVTLFKAGNPVVHSNILYGSTLAVPLVAKGNIDITIPRINVEKNLHSSLPNVKIKYVDYATAPIQKDDVMGEVIIKITDHKIYRVTLYAQNDVKRANFFQHAVQNVEKIWCMMINSSNCR